MIFPLPVNPWPSRARLFAQAASAVVAMAALAVFAAWILDIRELKSLYLPGPTLKTNASIALACSALANLLLASTVPESRWRFLVRAFAVVPVLVGGLTLLQHLGGWDFGIDQLLATEPAGELATVSPNRMGPPAATANVLLGVALLLASSRSADRRVFNQLLTSITAGIALLPLMGYAYGFSEFYAVARYTGISLLKAAALLVLSVAIKAARPERGLASFVCRGDEVGVFARRLLPAAILLPFFVGWLLVGLARAGIVDTTFALASMALALIVLLGMLIWWTGAEVSRLLNARALAERALSDRERSLREADQQKTEFLATLSHELRNPLAPIRSAVELLHGSPDAAVRARKTIERQVRHLTRLIDDLLDLTRINRNRLELDVRPSDLSQLVNEAVDAVSAEVARARHHLEIALPPQPVWLQADPDRVVQMLVNLLTNSIRYSDSGRTIQVGASADATHVTVIVRDQGHGIDPSDLDRIFERFVQVGHTRHGGLGIGLALVKALAELHGGSVEARSDGLGRGAEFRVRLPRATAPPPVRPTERPSIEPCRILVVDDNSDAADMLASLLAAGGHDVAVAYDGEGALRRAATFRPQVGLLDIGMVGMNGYELAARLRSDSKPGLFLVAITGWGQEDDRRRALAAGFDAHLTKPADPDAIAALLAARLPAATSAPKSAPSEGATVFDG